jgi:hypothetical protein
MFAQNLQLLRIITVPGLFDTFVLEKSTVINKTLSSSSPIEEPLFRETPIISPSPAEVNPVLNVADPPFR